MSLLFIAVTLLVACRKDEGGSNSNPPPKPHSGGKNPPEATNVFKAQSNVIQYDIPKGEEDQYILSVEEGKITLRYSESRNLRIDQKPLFVSYNDFVSGKSTPSKPKVGDVVCLVKSNKLPTGFIGEVNKVEYGAGHIVLHTQEPTIDKVTDFIDKDVTINFVNEILPDGGVGTAEVDLSKLLTVGVSEQFKKVFAESDKRDYLKFPKSRLVLKDGKMILTVSWDALNREKDTSEVKANLGISVSINPMMNLRIKKRSGMKLPDFLEARIYGDLRIDVDAELKALLKRKYGGKTVRLPGIKLPPIPIPGTPMYVTPELIVETKLTMEGEIDAQLKIFSAVVPFGATAGYDNARSPRFYAHGDDRKIVAEWLNDWSVMANLRYTEDVAVGVAFTLMGYKGFEGKVLAGISLEGLIQGSVRTDGDPKVQVTAEASAYIQPGFVINVGDIEWLDYSLERKFAITGKYKLFDKQFALGMEVRSTLDDVKELTDTSATFSGRLTMGEGSRAQIVEIGFVYAVHEMPTIEDQRLTYPQSIGNVLGGKREIRLSARGLTPETRYYCRMYSKYRLNGKVYIDYSPERSFTTAERKITLPEGVIIDDYGTLLNWPDSAIPESGLVLIPSSVKVIGIEVFSRSKKLKTVVMHDKVTRVEARAFMDCFMLEEITLSRNLQKLGELAFYGCVKLNQIVFPNTLFEIEKGALWNCVQLSKVYLPEGLKSIGSDAFAFCTALNNINIPEGVTKIGGGAFAGLKGSITLPSTIVELGLNNYTFSKDSSIDFKDRPTLYIKAKTPPKAYTTPQGKYVLGNFKILYVPVGCKQKYLDAIEGANNSNVQEYDFE